MPSRYTCRSAAIVAATLLVTACEDLFPARRQPPVAVVAASDSARAKPRRASPRDSGAREATGPEVEAAFREISQTLRRLVAAEQSFFAEIGTYSGDLAKVGFRPLGASRVEFVWVTKDGWAARATHPALPGRDCVTFTGLGGPVPATRRLNRSPREGVVACDFVMRAPPARPVAPPAGDHASSGRGSAPAPDPTPVVVDTTSALDAVDPIVQMRVDLRKLALAQTAYFGTQGTYSRRVETLPLQFAWQRGVSVTLIHADTRSWTARATHHARPGKSCVIWYGKPLHRPATATERRVPPGSGVPACDN
jgi:hypothetical protein